MPISPDLALAADQPRQVLRCSPGGADVVGGDVGERGVGIDAGIDRDHRHAGLDSLGHRRRQRLGVSRGNQDAVDPARHHVVDQVDLARDLRLVLGADIEDLVAELRSSLFSAPA